MVTLGDGRTSYIDKIKYFSVKMVSVDHKFLSKAENHR